MAARQTKLFGGSTPVGENDALGRFVYNLWSAIAHGSPHGITQSIDREHLALPKTLGGVTMGAVVTRSSEVILLVSIVLSALLEVHQRRNRLFGWTSRPWVDAMRAAVVAYNKHGLRPD